ncbi:2-keto-4-pentenoate hydratase [Arenimonas sp.]|uniref:2-keto-4-pentenoate hydratase n=1 Tax=Arenimonas sp. TaxID=1872635 RepID=UPI0039E53CFE
MSPTPSGSAPSPKFVASAFGRAREQARALDEFPGGVLPADLEAAYRIQDWAIDHWPDQLVGWKVGFIAPSRRDASGDDRLVGPIFARSVWPLRSGDSVDVPVFDGGFAAVEAEFVFRLAVDAPDGKLEWTSQEALALVAALHFGIEMAGSPLATINELGPTVVVSDFGNNAGVVLGPEIPGWRERQEDGMRCATYVDDQLVGTGTAASVPGGLGEALAFALRRCARRGIPLRAGMLVTTGAATGIHDILPGQRGRVVFEGFGELRCRAIAASPAGMTR